MSDHMWARAAPHRRGGDAAVAAKSDAREDLYARCDCTWI